jgi:hypothetical protein
MALFLYVCNVVAETPIMSTLEQIWTLLTEYKLLLPSPQKSSDDPLLHEILWIRKITNLLETYYQALVQKRKSFQDHLPQALFIFISSFLSHDYASHLLLTCRQWNKFGVNHWKPQRISFLYHIRNMTGKQIATGI